MFFSYICNLKTLHGKNDFAEVSKNSVTLDTDLKIMLLNYQKN